MESSVSIKGQITLPKELRVKAGVKPGDRVKFFLNANGSIVILPKVPVSALKGIVPPRKEGPVTIEEMDDAIAAGAAERAGLRKRR